MSNENIQATQPTESRIVLREDQGTGIEVVMGQFAADSKGFEKGLKFAKPSITTKNGKDVAFSAALSLFTTLPEGPAATPEAIASAEKNGLEQLVNVINQAISLKIGNMVKNTKVPKNVGADVAANQLATLMKSDPDGKNLIFTVDEALKWHPGERGPSAKDIESEMLEGARSGKLTPDEIYKLAIQLAQKKRA